MAVPRLAWLVPPDWHPTLFAALILVVLAPGILLTAGAGLVFGLTVGWPRHRMLRVATLGSVVTVFFGLYLIDRAVPDPALRSYIVIGTVLAMTFAVAPTLLGMVIRGDTSRPWSGAEDDADR